MQLELQPGHSKCEALRQRRVHGMIRVPVPAFPRMTTTLPSQCSRAVVVATGRRSACCRAGVRIQLATPKCSVGIQQAFQPEPSTTAAAGGTARQEQQEEAAAPASAAPAQHRERSAAARGYATRSPDALFVLRREAHVFQEVDHASRRREREVRELVQVRRRRRGRRLWHVWCACNTLMWVRPGGPRRGPVHRARCRPGRRLR